MMSNIKLNLLENATHSLNEALSKYQQGKNGDPIAYKFCIQNLVHFIELILKFYITQSHPLLIYKNPFARNIKEDSRTIGFQDAINFLKNEGYDISEKFEKDLNWLKDLRNNIEHHRFSMDLEEVEGTIGRLMSALDKFDEHHENIDLSSYVSSDKYELFYALSNRYKRHVTSVEILLDDDVSGHLIGISRCSSVISKNDYGDEIKDHQDLIDNTNYYSAEELIEDVARRLNVAPEIVEIVG